MTEPADNSFGGPSVEPPTDGVASNGHSPPAGPAGLSAFCRTLAGNLGRSAAALFDGLQLEAGRLGPMRYAEFLSSVGEPACCWLLEGRAGGQATGHLIWLELSPNVAAAMVDSLLGGSRELPPRPITSIDRRLLRRYVDAVADAIQITCSRVAPLKVALPDSQRARPGADETVFAATFTISLSSRQGTMRLCLPAAIAQAATATGQARQAGDEVEVSVTTDETRIPRSQLAGLAAGDVLVTDSDADGEIIVRLNGKKAFAGRLGSSNGKRAVTITRPADQA